MWTRHNGEIELDQSDEQELSDVLIGRRVDKVNEHTLLLDDGTVLEVRGNEGGCSCGAGDYDLTELNGVDNVITAVSVETGYTDGEDRDDWDGGAQWYKIFVYAENQQIMLAEFSGDDGNGYYGTGFNISVRKANP